LQTFRDIDSFYRHCFKPSTRSQLSRFGLLAYYWRRIEKEWLNWLNGVQCTTYVSNTYCLTPDILLT